MTSKPIEAHRGVIEAEMQKWLDQIGSQVSLKKIREVISQWPDDAVTEYLEVMFAVFRTDIDAIDQEDLQLIQDAWNYFPHRFLNGRSPIEVFEELQR